MAWSAADEGRHDDGGGSETWTLGFTGDVDGLVGEVVGEVRLGLGRVTGFASFLVDLRLPDLGRVVVADDEVPRPRPGAGLELRADGLWALLLCETPFEHWTFGLEAFGLRLDADEAARFAAGRAAADLVGERLPVGFDLEWELSGPPEALAVGPGYRQPGTVRGDLLVERARITCDAVGWREHRW